MNTMNTQQWFMIAADVMVAILLTYNVCLALRSRKAMKRIKEQELLWEALIWEMEHRVASLRGANGLGKSTLISPNLSIPMPSGARPVPEMSVITKGWFTLRRRRAPMQTLEKEDREDNA